MQSAIDVSRSAGVVAMEAQLDGDDPGQVTARFDQVGSVERGIWETDRTGHRVDVPVHPGRRWVAVRRVVCRHLREWTLATKRSNHAQVPYELGGEAVVDESLVPSFLTAACDDEED